MMKLANMSIVIGTLNERRGCSIADEIASRWEHTEGSVRFFRASANFLFTFEHADRAFFLRFIHAAERNQSSIQAEMNYLQYLATRGVSVAIPVRSSAGHLVEAVSTARGTWNAVVFERLTGNSFESNELTPEQIVRWGQTLGALHNATQGFSVGARASWHDHTVHVALQMPAGDPLISKLDRIRNQLEQLPVRNDNFGLIHYDFEPDNLVWNGMQASIVDFDDCANYWFAADIAFALREAFSDSPGRVNLANRTAQQFLSGYRLERDIENTELQRIPLFLALHNLVTMTRLQDALAQASSGDEPEWSAALRKKLETKVDSYRAQIAEFQVN